MLARDWYYTQRRQLGLDSAVASIYDRHDDSDIRARAALTMLGVQRGWRLADIGCGEGGRRGVGEGGRVRLVRYFAGVCGDRHYRGALPQGRDLLPAGGHVDFCVSAQF